ncbi:MAG: autotransporter outer membrane beta-barrel domain-containing protein [Nitrospirota bacterium]
MRSRLGHAARWVLFGVACAWWAPVPAARAEPIDDTRWSASVGVGYFTPEIEGWEAQYGRAGGWVPTLGAKYAVTPFVAVMVDAGYFTAGSFARGSLSGRVSGDHQRLVLWPITVGLEGAFRVSEDQLLTPFLSAGYRRALYRLAVDGKDSVRGAAGGLLVGVGIDVLLNGLDPSSAAAFHEEYGVARTSFRVEAQWAKIQAPGTDSDVDLGGRTVVAALKFDF